MFDMLATPEIVSGWDEPRPRMTVKTFSAAEEEKFRKKGERRGRLSVIGYRLSAIGYRLTVVGNN
jgi:hypothetical protein